MAPDISLDLINSQAMADNLRDLDPTISERAMIARLIWQIDLLALIKLDNNARQIQVHRVVQAVVNERMSEEERAAARRVVHQLLVEVRPQGDVDDPRTWPRYRLIWPHLTAVARPSGHPRRGSASCSSSGCAISGSGRTWSAASAERKRSSDAWRTMLGRAA